MSKCLVTKLNGSCNNTELLKIGEFKIKFNKVSNPTKNNRSLNIGVNKECKVDLIGDGYFTDSNLTANKGKSLVLSPSSDNYIYISNNDVYISIEDKYCITKLIAQDSSLPWLVSGDKSHISFDIANLKYLTALTGIGLSSTLVTGDISALSNLTALTYIYLSSTSVTGDISALSNLTALNNIYLSSTLVTGDISALSNLTALNNIYLSSTSVTGDISALSNLTALTGIYLEKTSVTGDISALSNLTALNNIYLRYLNLKGNVSSLNKLSKLQNLLVQGSVSFDADTLGTLQNLSNVELWRGSVTGDISKLPNAFSYLMANNSTLLNPVWTKRSPDANIIAMPFVIISMENVDAMLQNEAECMNVTNKNGNTAIISVKGTRTEASDSAVQTLQNYGYTVKITPKS